MKALDLFAGPGGWDVGATALGINPLGIEFDDAACATRKAAGHRTLQADVAALDPRDFAPCDLLIASPPCQAWSMAGKRQGREDIERVYELTWAIAGRPTHMAKNENQPGRVAQATGNRPRAIEAPAATLDTRADLAKWISEPPEDDWADSRSRLVTEPLRWALALRPRYLAFEQVPPVLGYWERIAEILRTEGYGVWTGILEAERFGVPQTRKRAILMAERDGNPHPPKPTHQRYASGEAARHEITLEGEILPWVSMAEALGWAENEATGQATARECVQVGFPRRDDLGASEDGFRERDWRDEDEPAFAVTEKARSAVKRQLVNNAQVNAAVRAEDEPASTLTAGHDSGERRWLRAGTNDHDVSRPDDEPAPTIRYGERMVDVSWTEDRPATADCGDPRISPPGYRGRAANYDADGKLAPDKRSGDNAVRVSVTEASILQGFNPAYPWQGSRTKQFQQIGNAVPPPLALAVLSELLGGVA